MDELKIEGQFVTGLLSKIFKNVMRKKVGYAIDAQLKNLNIKYVNDNIVIECSTKIEIPKEELLKMIKENGLL